MFPDEGRPSWWSPEFEEVYEVGQLNETCLNEVQRADRAIAKQDDDYARRQYVRVVVSHAEALATMLKRLAKRWTSVFTDAERSILSEESHRLDDAGRVKTGTLMLTVDSNLRFAFSVSGRPHDLAFQLDVGGNGWREFKATIGIRNRLVHPRKFVDLSISDDELGAARRAHDWLKAEHVRFVDLLTAKILYEEGMSADEIAEFKARVADVKLPRSDLDE